MKTYKKPLKFYLLIFAFSAIIILTYNIYMVASGNATWSQMSSYWLLPVMITLIYYGGDTMIQKIMGRKRNVNYEQQFLEVIGEKMRASNAFLIEDFRRLQQNRIFQDQLKVAFDVYKNGESENHNIDRLEKKFREGSLEAKAMAFVVVYLREKNEANSK